MRCWHLSVCVGVHLFVCAFDCACFVCVCRFLNVYVPLCTGYVCRSSVNLRANLCVCRFGCSCVHCLCLGTCVFCYVRCLNLHVHATCVCVCDLGHRLLIVSSKILHPVGRLINYSSGSMCGVQT